MIEPLLTPEKFYKKWATAQVKDDEAEKFIDKLIKESSEIQQTFKLFREYAAHVLNWTLEDLKATVIADEKKQDLHGLQAVSHKRMIMFIDEYIAEINKKEAIDADNS